MVSDSQVLQTLLTTDPTALKPEVMDNSIGQPIKPKEQQLAMAVTTPNPIVDTTAPISQPESLSTAAVMGNAYKAIFSFSSQARATNFLGQLLREAYTCSISTISVGFAPESDGVFGVSLELPDQAEEHSILVHYAQYLYARATVKDGSYYYYSNKTGLNDESLAQPESKKVVEGLSADEKLSAATLLNNVETEQDDTDYSWVQTLSDQGLGYDETTKMLKVPFAVIGSWSHPVYKRVTFTQRDFDQMKANFSSNVLGFEPPLFLGHPVDTTTSEGQPAEAFLVELVQESDTLYGLFEAVSQETYSAVASGQYRYSSGEFVRNCPSKVDGTSLGTVLMGVALTNRPFLPGLPRVTALSDGIARTETEAGDDSSGEHLSCVFKLANPVQMMTTNNNTQAEEGQIQVEPVTSETQLADVQVSQTFASPKETDSEQIKIFKEEVRQELSHLTNSYKESLAAYQTKLSVTQQQLADSLATNEQLRTRISVIEERHNLAEVQRKLGELEALTLPQEVKEKYSELIRNGSLGEMEETVLNTLKDMATNHMVMATQQHGTSTSTQALNDETLSDPYANTIVTNSERVRRRQEVLESLLS